MEYRVDISPEALAQAIEARDWIADSSPDRAAKWLDKLLESIESLKTFPLRCPSAPDRDAYGEDVRVLLYGKRRGIYRVLFTVQDDLIVVVAIRHGARGTSLG